MEANNTSILQESREKEIPNIIEKYKKLADQILTQVSSTVPTFKEINLKDGEDIIKTISAEEQLYNFMLMREKAVDHADRLYNKINNLELEKNSPELFKSLQNKENVPAANIDVPAPNPVKKRLNQGK